jgi:hypothetical protein
MISKQCNPFNYRKNPIKCICTWYKRIANDNKNYENRKVKILESEATA